MAHQTMSFLPTDLVSFIWGIVLALLGAFFTGFFKKAGEHGYEAVRARLLPPPKQPVEVDRHFEPTLFKPEACAWVRETRVQEFEEKRYTHYPHATGAPGCYRITSNGISSFKEFLMVTPDAERA